MSTEKIARLEDEVKELAKRLAKDVELFVEGESCNTLVLSISFGTCISCSTSIIQAFMSMSI